MSPLVLRLLPYTVALALLAGALFGAYRHGVSVTDDKWQSRWSARNAQDAEARAENEAAARDREQAYQRSIEKATQDGQRTIDQAITDASAARASAAGLREAADHFADRLSASEVSGNSCTAAASKAAASAAMVLADVLKRADQRAGDLAAIADQARARGLACEQAYDGLSR
jgi:hypothetical protein